MINQRKTKFSRIQTSWAIDHLMDKVDSSIFNRSSSNMCTNLIAKQVSLTNKQSVQQIASVQPSKSIKLQQDLKPNKSAKVPDRPYSAKVEKISKQIEDVAKFKRMLDARNLRLSSKKNIHSYKSIKSNGSKTFVETKNKIRNNTLIALQINKEEEDINDKTIDKLRKQKLKKQEYEQKKSRFMKSINKQNEIYQKDQSKFHSTFTNKDHTYGLSGNLIEIPKKSNNSKLKRRNYINVPIIRTSSKKNDEQSIDNQALVVQYTADMAHCQKKEYVFDDDHQQNKVFIKNTLYSGTNDTKKNPIKYTLITEEL